MSEFWEGWAGRAAEIETRKRRLVILAYLARTMGYEASATLLRYECWRLGVPTTDDQLLAAMQWLAEHEMVEIRTVEVPVARLTTFGQDVALGIGSHPGVLRPDP